MGNKDWSPYFCALCGRKLMFGKREGRTETYYWCQKAHTWLRVEPPEALETFYEVSPMDMYAKGDLKAMSHVEPQPKAAGE